MNECSTYKLDFANGKSYIGISVNVARRMYEHETGDFAVGHAIRKHGAPEVSIEFEGTVEDCKWKEVELIYVHNTKAPNGYNLTDGGDGCHGPRNAPSEETRAKIRSTLLAKSPEEQAETIAKFRATLNSRTPEEQAEVAANMSASRIGKKRGPFTAEHCANISKGQKGKVFSLETREKMRQAQLGSKHSEETKAKMRGPRKPYGPRKTQSERGES